MKRVFFSLVLGFGLGAGTVWYYFQQHEQDAAARAQETLTQRAGQMKDALGEKWSELTADDIREELSKTGKVVRKKARELGGKIADATANARITAAIKAKLALDSGLSAVSIGVNTTDGVVTLSGAVSSHDHIGKAMKLAMETDGVREVISTLQVKQAK